MAATVSAPTVFGGASAGNQQSCIGEAVEYFYSALEVGTEAVLLAPCTVCGDGAAAVPEEEHSPLPGAIQLLAASESEDSVEPKTGEGNEDAVQNNEQKIDENAMRAAEDTVKNVDDSTVQTKDSVETEIVCDNSSADEKGKEPEVEVKLLKDPEDSQPGELKLVDEKFKGKSTGCRGPNEYFFCGNTLNVLDSAETIVKSLYEDDEDVWTRRAHSNLTSFDADDSFILDMSVVRSNFGEIKKLQEEKLALIKERLDAEQHALLAMALSDEEGDDARSQELLNDKTKLDRALGRIGVLKAQVEAYRAEFEVKKLELEAMMVEEEISQRSGGSRGGSTAVASLLTDASDDSDDSDNHNPPTSFAIVKEEKKSPKRSPFLNIGEKFSDSEDSQDSDVSEVSGETFEVKA